MPVDFAFFFLVFTVTYRSLEGLSLYGPTVTIDLLEERFGYGYPRSCNSLHAINSHVKPHKLSSYGCIVMDTYILQNTMT
ncbi:hypothetical protein CFIMG_005760RAa [Ceratocystis fimbriata CBS 114723]|uniref:Secreted protein n=1 Tax=Ceratocystis fimbriata CBS 114723 TaxID=1035309 RepID=A0A2C5X1K5_9PEZI|nr:hypothetical protein CFIMG_005760RAa [Ceratocystis fimbriata CBS 114723]